MEIYITDLQAYNEGHLVGLWQILPIGEIHLAEVIEEALAQGAEACNNSEAHEEVFITDYEANIEIEEYDNIHKLNELAQTMQEFTDDELLKLQLLSAEGYNEREVIDTGIDTYDVDIYDYRDSTSYTDTFELLASDLVDDGCFGEIPKALEYYIDYEAIARDLRMDYTEFETNVIGRVA